MLITKIEIIFKYEIIYVQIDYNILRTSHRVRTIINKMQMQCYC